MTGNLLVIMSDEHQARAMGCAGHDFVKTPNLDRLASDGLRFASAYTPSPICVPARASFAVGKYVHQIRLWDNAMPYTGAIPGWGHALQAEGIAVESIGKLHYRASEDPAGFDIKHIPMMVANGVGMVWASIRREDERLVRDRRMLGEYIGPGHSDYTRYDEAIVQRTQEWLSMRKGSDGPWCLFVGLVAPHFPLVVPSEFYEMYPAEQLPAVKLHPRDGHARHPWVEKQNAFMDSEAKFKSEEERLSAMASYYGLCTWLDSNVGRILDTLESEGFKESTTVVYTSDHGDNVGARGLWGKSNLYQESTAIPLIISGPNVPNGVCETPVSLLDLSCTIADHFGTSIEAAAGSKSLYSIADNPVEPDRMVFSEYHAVGSVSGAYMLRKGRWKYHHYVGFESELFGLQTDPEETTNLASDPSISTVVDSMHEALLAICNPEQTDAQAFKDQAELVKRFGGREAVFKIGKPGATPTPEVLN